MKRLLLTGIASLALAACGGGSDTATTAPPATTPYQATAIVDWNNVALDAVRNGTLGPPAVARALGMMHSAMFDAWAVYDDRAKAVASAAPAKAAASERSDANKIAAVSVAAAAVLSDVFPEQKAKFEAKLSAQGLTLNSANAAAQVGAQAAQAIIAERHADGSNQLNGYADTSGYVPRNSVDQLNDVSYWQALEFCNGKKPGYLLPHWGTVKPFALANGAALRPKERPAMYGEPKFMQQALDVLAITAGLTEAQKLSAEYWADGPKSETPPGHWFLFAQAASAHYRYTLDQDVMLYMALGNAVMDAGIATWDVKRAYESVRPITAIRYLFKDQMIKSWVKDGGTQLIRGQDWLPYQVCTFTTPPFPEFTSGHSAFSAAGAEILKRFTGSDANFHTDTVQPGSYRTEANVPKAATTMTWPSYTEAAADSGMSRRYGGIHFEDGDLVGRQLGRNVADVVWQKAVTHFNR